jgi:hypothetical protein
MKAAFALLSREHDTLLRIGETTADDMIKRSAGGSDERAHQRQRDHRNLPADAVAAVHRYLTLHGGTVAIIVQTTADDIKG